MAAAIGAGLFFFLLLPHRALGNDFVYERFPTALGLLFFAATDVRIPGRVWRRVLGGFVVVLIGLRVGVVAFQWHLHQADLSSMLRVMRLVEPGSKIVVAAMPIDDRRGSLPRRQLAFGFLPSLEHVPTLAIIERSAFVPSLFTEEGKSPIRVRPKYRHLGKRTDGPQPTFAALTHVWRTQLAVVPQGMYWGRWWKDFDYLIVPELNPPEDDGFADRLPLTLEAREPLIALYRIGEVQAPRGRE